MTVSGPKKSREERLAEKLRENLKRRKSQARVRSGVEKPAPGKPGNKGSS